MADYKGAGVVFVRNHARARGPVAEQALLARLDDADVQAYHSTLATQWVPIEFITRLFVAAAAALYPGRPDGLREVSRALVHHDLRGILRVVVRLMSVSSVIERSAGLWTAYHAKGTARSEGDPANGLGYYIVDGYPELPERFREGLCGYIYGLMEICGGHDIRVAKLNDDPNSWRWRISYR